MSDTQRSTADFPATGIGPDERGIERLPPDPPSLRLWALALAGPVLWFTHFMAVYLFTEAACAPPAEPSESTIGDGTISVIVLVATLMALVAVAAATAWAARTVRSADGAIGTNPGTMGRVGVLTGVCSLVAVLAVGLPALVLSPC